MPTPPLDLDAAKARFWRYLREAYGLRRTCERCGGAVGVEAESSRTMYPYEGPRGSADDPNRDVWLCRECAAEHHKYWDDLWWEYRSGQL